MKKYLFFLLLLVFSSVSFGQDVRDIFKRAFEKCQSIQNGHFEMERRMKHSDGTDTSFSSYKYNFKKLQNDSLFSSLFHYQRIDDEKYTSEVMYTGKELITAWAGDSTAKITSKELWGSEIKEISRNLTYYSPLSNRYSYPLPADSDYVKKQHEYTYLGEEKIGKTICHHIRRCDSSLNYPEGALRLIQLVTDYWISKNDYIPLQYSIRFDDVYLEKDFMQQYEQLTLTKYELNNLKDETPFQISSIPSFYKLEDYVPHVDTMPRSLSENVTAPDWTLLSLEDRTVKLSDFKGKLVLLDFFYRSCYPCMLALPVLQKLHEKFKDDGLVVIGIDPYDTKEKGIVEFLAKHISYTVVLDKEKNVEKSYAVRAFPTLYLIDKKGTVIHVQIGFGKGLEEELEKIINENL